MKTCIVIFGRMNPVHLGHKKLFDYALDLHASTGYNLNVYLSRKVDSINPLPRDIKCDMIQDFFPEIHMHIKHNTGTLFGILEELDEVYDDIIFLVGSDRQSEFDQLLQRYNGHLYNFNSIKCISVGERDDDNYSSTNMRESVKNDDYQLFSTFLPSTDDLKLKYFNLLKNYMGV